MLTVLFCDLVGSTELTFRIDVEDAARVLSEYLKRVTAVIEGNGGHVARTSGDGVLAYFGFPNAREDDTSRAVRAAIAIVDDLIGSSSPTLRVRIGIAKGEVIVSEGEGSKGDLPSIVGHAANLAARLQALAAPDTTIVSHDVFADTKTNFHFHDLGSKPIKGLPIEERVYLVVSERKSRIRTRSLPPIMGRDVELLNLVEYWGEAKRGQGRGVLISGEAGIGKSRLAAGLEHIARSEGALTVRLQSSPHRSNSDLHPLHEHLRTVAGIQLSDSDGVRRRKLERVLALSSLSAPSEGLVDCLVEIGSQSQVNPTSASMQRERQICSLIDGLAALSAVKPILILHEDAQ